MKCSFYYNSSDYPTGTKWCFNDLREAIIGEEIGIKLDEYRTIEDKFSGSAKIINFKYIYPQKIYCDIDFKIISLDEKYIDTPLKIISIRGPMFTKDYYSNHFPLAILVFNIKIDC